MKVFDTFDSWYKCQSTGQKRIISRLRNLVSKTSPSLVESDHIQFGFFGGALLSSTVLAVTIKNSFISEGIFIFEDGGYCYGEHFEKSQKVAVVEAVNRCFPHHIIKVSPWINTCGGSYYARLTTSI